MESGHLICDQSLTRYCVAKSAPDRNRQGHNDQGGGLDDSKNFNAAIHEGS
jgi:hypothetical protein